LAELDADLELDLDAGEKLELKVAELLLNVLRNAFEVVPVLAGLEGVGSVFVHQGADLVVAVGDLSFDDDDELEADANVLLVLVLLLQLGSEVLARGEFVLQVLELFRSPAWLLDLVGEVGSTNELMLEIVENIGAKRQVEWVEGLRRQVGRNVLGKLVLEFVGTLGLGKGVESWAHVVDEVAALGFELGWSVGLRKLSTKGVDKVTLKVVLQFVDDEEC
jgi:hypothetical protein